MFALAKTLGKTPVVVRDAPGFLVNRILAPYLSEAVRLVAEGCRIEDVDAAMTRFGMPVGPLALLDDVGLDVAAKAGEVLQAAFPERLRIGGEHALVAAGRLGRKNGRGFYTYEDGKRGRPAPEAYAALRVAPPDRSPLPAEIIESRLILPMINEAAFCLEDRIVERAREARSRDDLRDRLPAVPGRAAPVRGQPRRRPRLHPPRRPLRAAGPAFRPGGAAAVAGEHSKRVLSGRRCSGRPGGDAMMERLSGSVALAADPLRTPVVKSLFGQIPEDTVFPYPEIAPAEKETVSAFLDSLRGFARDHIDPAKIEREHRIPPEVMKGLAELGAFGMTIPEAYGGYGFSSSAYCRVTEGNRHDRRLARHPHRGPSVDRDEGSAPLRQRGAEAALAAGPRGGEMIAAFALTEPEAGSDAASIRTTAEYDEKAGVFVLNGSKHWISNGGFADFFTVFAKDVGLPAKDEHRRITAFAVTKDLGGVLPGKEERKLGLKGSSTEPISSRTSGCRLRTSSASGGRDSRSPSRSSTPAGPRSARAASGDARRCCARPPGTPRSASSSERGSPTSR